VTRAHRAQSLPYARCMPDGLQGSLEGRRWTTAEPAGVGVNRDAMRRHNIATMLRLVHYQTHLTRASLTSQMGLSRSTIGELLEQLSDLGIVALLDPPRTPGYVGRASPDVRLVPESAQAIAVHVGRDLLRAAAIGLGGAVLSHFERPIEGLHSPEHVADALIELLGKLTADAPPEVPLVGLGVGVPGMVGDDGRIRLAPSLGWSDVPFAAMLERRLPPSLRLSLSNDGELGALAEHIRGAGAGTEHMVFVGCDDWGVGAGVISGGAVLRGVGGYAGELGHLIVSPRGRRCRCGGTGCWETEIGAARVAEALNLDGQALTSLEAALSGLKGPPAKLRRVGRYLGLGLGNIVNTLNPEMIVLGGTLRDLYAVVKVDTDAAMAKAALEAPHAQVRLVLSALGADAVLVGAAETAMNTFLADPVGTLTVAHRGPVS